MSAPRKFENLTFSLYPNANETMMFECYYRNGKWEEGKITQFHPIQLSPAANILNYGQGIFEGMKAYRSENGSIVMFRPEENAKRFARSCEVMAMPKVPEELYMQAVKDIVIANQEFVPDSQGGKYSLYLRPVCIGIEAQLGVKPAKEYLFYIYVSPVGPYYSGVGVIDLQVTNFHRAAPNGTGHAKAVCNYAGSMRPAQQAIANGYNGVLFLDARHDQNVEEAGAANIFALFEDNVLVTPQLGSILPGITRDSIIRIAREQYGMKVEERNLPIDELCNDAIECFVCGTGAIITSVNNIAWDNKVYNVNSNKFQLAHKLYDDLLGIQLQKKPDPYNWVRTIIPAS